MIITSKAVTNHGCRSTEQNIVDSLILTHAHQ